jgi:hypothetical protein
MFGSLVRKVRGIVGTGLSWAFGWSIAGTALHAGLALFGLVSRPDLLVEPFMYGVWGLFGGSVFAGILAVAEHRRTLPELRPARMAVWGALAGVSVPVVYHLLGGGAGWAWFSGVATTPEVWASLAIIAPLGAASATAMTAIARSDSEALLDDPLARTPLPKVDPHG